MCSSTMSASSAASWSDHSARLSWSTGPKVTTKRLGARTRPPLRTERCSSASRCRAWAISAGWTLPLKTRANARPTMPSRRRSKRCSTPTVAPLRSLTSHCLCADRNRGRVSGPVGKRRTPREDLTGAVPRTVYQRAEPDRRRPRRKRRGRGWGGRPREPPASVLPRQGKWRNGRRARFRSVCPKGRGGSTPPLPTQDWGTPQQLPPVVTGEVDRHARPVREKSSQPAVQGLAAGRLPGVVEVLLGLLLSRFLERVRAPVVEGGAAVGRVQGQVAQPFADEDGVLVLPERLLHRPHRLRGRGGV